MTRFQLLPLVAGLLVPSAAALSIPSPQQILETFTFGETSDLCPLAQKVEVPHDGFFPALKFVEDSSFKSRQVHRLSRAVQVPTTVDDYMRDPYDEKFAPFADFQNLLQTLFPLTYVSTPIYTYSPNAIQSLLRARRPHQPIRPRFHPQWHR